MIPVQRRRRTLLAATVAAIALAVAPPAAGWDHLGHRVVARIAWEEMTPAARQRAVELLLAAPANSHLPALFPADRRPRDERAREFFTRAGFWADLIRDEDHPERRERYHRSSWHYVNFFWERPRPDGPVRERPDLRPARENVVERLAKFDASIADDRLALAERAIDLAWLLHLVGDVHQPLHTSARVTPEEPEGDRGGNLFKLDPEEKENLHAYWDGALSRGWPKRWWESDDARVGRVAARLARRHPRRDFAGRLAPGAYERWAREGVITAQDTAYPSYLRRDRWPPWRYACAVDRAVEPALALAGYRLADLLNRRLDDER